MSEQSVQENHQSYCYEFPRPAVTVDIILFSFHANDLKVLLIQRRHEPFQGAWALPGGFVEMDEDLHTAAFRELAEETNVTDVYLEQLYTFGRPDRDPRTPAASDSPRRSAPSALQ